MKYDIKQLLTLVHESNASDLLITAQTPPVLRINGELKPLDGDPLTPEETKKLVYSILNEEQVSRFEHEKELDFSIGISTENRFRVNCYIQRGAVASALRTIPTRIPALADLGVPKIMKDLALRHQGLVLVTGPTGHGKTTTQAAMIDHINENRRCHIITVEDPIEYVHHHKQSIIDQREILEDTKSFVGALKYVLRQDPDVILIGEMRDLETISACLTAAETGHLVLATLHTNDAAQTIDRIIDVFPPHQQSQIRTQLAAVLLSVISQQLIPTANGEGRALAVEIMVNTPAIANLIREAKTHQVPSVIETSTREGMQSRDKCIKELYMKGIVAYDEALRRMKNPGELMRMME